MTEQEATMLIQKIKLEEAGRINATLSTTKNRGVQHAAVELFLKPGQRKIRIVSVDDWPSIKLAWSELAKL